MSAPPAPALRLPEPEWRWRCRKCKRDFPEERYYVAFIENEFLFGLRGPLGFYREGEDFSTERFAKAQEAVVPLAYSGPAERAHRVVSYTAGRTGYLGGVRKSEEICGTIRLTEIDPQELFLEFGEKR